MFSTPLRRPRSIQVLCAGLATVQFLNAGIAFDAGHYEQDAHRLELGK